MLQTVGCYKQFMSQTVGCYKQLDDTNKAISRVRIS
jgi:hypothetical protein